MTWINGRHFFHNLDGKLNTETMYLGVALKQKGKVVFHMSGTYFSSGQIQTRRGKPKCRFLRWRIISTFMFKEIPDFSENKGSSAHSRRYLGPHPFSVTVMPLKRLSLGFYTGQTPTIVNFICTAHHWRSQWAIGHALFFAGISRLFTG